MTTTPFPTNSTGGRHEAHRSFPVLLVASVVSLLLMLAFLSAGARPAGATEFFSNPTLSVLNSCENGEYVYSVGMYNFDANDATVFTVTDQEENGPLHSESYEILGGGLKWITFVVPEATTSTFHVTNDDDPSIDFTAAPRADCVADTESTVIVSCPSDDSGAEMIFDWVNTSYTSAHFAVHLPDGSTQDSDLVWSSGPKHLGVPVAEGDHVQGSIVVDGDTKSVVDQVVDCLPDTISTIPDPTIPDTTVPDTTVPDTTVPDTTSTTVVDDSTTTSTQVPEVLDAGETFPSTSEQVAEVEHVSVENADRVPTQLAFTGGETALLALVGFLLLGAGLTSYTITRRLTRRTEV